MHKVFKLRSQRQACIRQRKNSI